MAAVLQLSQVTKAYGALRALDGIDISLPDNAYISLLGPSGSGKTILLRVIAGFEAPDSGSILFKGERVEAVPPHRRNIGFVFQNFALFPHLSVAGNIAFGLENRELNPITDSAVVRARVKDIVALVGLTGLEDRGVAQISGGQRQRVALARTLITEPSLVLLDEPLAALDANLRTRMRAELHNGALTRATRERIGLAVAERRGDASTLSQFARTARSAGLGLAEVSRARGVTSSEEKDAALLERFERVDPLAGIGGVRGEGSLRPVGRAVEGCGVGAPANEVVRWLATYDELLDVGGDAGLGRAR